MKPPISGKELSKILFKLGFESLRQTGSHMFLQNKTTNIRTTIPIHNNKDLGIGLLNKILKDVNLTKNELQKLR
jgi:predicted RNA binding protein YcfA (HicA-like mRNA interferase family)